MYHFHQPFSLLHWQAWKSQNTDSSQGRSHAKWQTEQRLLSVERSTSLEALSRSTLYEERDTCYGWPQMSLFPRYLRNHNDPVTFHPVINILALVANWKDWCVWVCMCMYVYVCVYMYVYVCVCMCIYVCVCMCMYVYICHQTQHTSTSNTTYLHIKHMNILADVPHWLAFFVITTEAQTNIVVDTLSCK